MAQELSPGSRRERGKEQIAAPQSPRGGIIAAVEPGSLAARMGLQCGDELLTVNDHVVEDVIDVQFYAAEDRVQVVYRRGGSLQSATHNRKPGQPLGLEFVHPTFDTDIRRCNNQCAFCFVRQMPPRMRRTLYIKDDDYRYSFLYGHYVTLTNLAPRDYERIERQRLSPLYISVHATELDLRRRLLGNQAAPDILEQLAWLARCSIQVHTQIVVIPGLNDGEHLERSVRDLARFWPHVQSVSIVPVGITRHHKHGIRPNTLPEMNVMLDNVHRWQKDFRKKFGVRLVYPTDEWYLATGRPIPPRAHYDNLHLEENGLGMVRGFLEDWRKLKRKIPTLKFRDAKHKITLATGELFAPMLRTVADEFTRLCGVQLDVIPIRNERLGETITVAGLLMGEDVIAQLQAHKLGKTIALPRIMFDHPTGAALDDVSPADITDTLGRPIVLADTMHDLLEALTEPE